ncbi:MAG: RNA-binding S4 domain-containing protein [Trueperaceae bacterium]
MRDGGNKGEKAVPAGEQPDYLEADQPAMRLDDVLKFFGVAATGGHAKHLIQAGEVRVNGVVETRRKRRIVDGDTVEAAGEAFVVELVPAPEE